MQEADEKSVIVIEGRGIAPAELPKLIVDAGAAANFAWEEFFIGKLRNPYTRRAYLRAVRSFLAWAEPLVSDLGRITPGLVGRYFDQLQVSIPSKKLYLAAIRSFFDVLVQRHAIVINPAHSVRMERYSVLEGKTQEITVEQAKRLLASIELCSVIDYRDRALIAVLIYTAARAGAVARLRLQDFVDEGRRFSLRFQEKGGKHRLIPAREDLEQYILEYLVVGALAEKPKDSPLFRTVAGRRLGLSSQAMSGIDVCRMVKRRLKAAGLPILASPHSFRSLTATDLLLQGIDLESVQRLLGHRDSRTTALYDRRQKQVVRNIVERISV